MSKGKEHSKVKKKKLVKQLINYNKQKQNPSIQLPETSSLKQINKTK